LIAISLSSITFFFKAKQPKSRPQIITSRQSPILALEYPEQENQTMMQMTAAAAWAYLATNLDALDRQPVLIE
jgi:hypothetical protein